MTTQRVRYQRGIGWTTERPAIVQSPFTRRALTSSLPGKELRSTAR